MARGFFLTFEGLDGSGKTTQLRLLEARLRAEGHSVVTLRQPGGTPLGDRLRTLLLDSHPEASDRAAPITPLAELALMFADRAQSIAEVIEPALAAGSLVLCDRYTDSSEAYQGFGRRLGSAPILALHQTLCHNLQPDLTLLLMPDRHAALARARARNTTHAGPQENRFEAEPDTFYQRVVAGYEAIALREPHRVQVFRSSAAIPEIAAEILTLVTSHLPQRVAHT